MSDDIIELIDAHDKLVAEAVQAERKRCLTILGDEKIVALRRADDNSADALGRCRLAIREPEPAPPPVEEPMTVAKLLANIRGGPMTWRHGPDSEKDLIRLVQEQARRDAELVQDRLLPPLGESTATAILKSVGLE